jgi:hypothetical protein
MSEWRRVAVEKIPSLQKQIQSPEIDNPMMLWIDLQMALQDAYQSSPAKTSIINEIWNYAKWSEQSKNDDVKQALYCAFYEHVLDYPQIVRDLPNRLKLSEFDGLKHCLLYHSNEESFLKARALFKKC